MFLNISLKLFEKTGPREKRTKHAIPEIQNRKSSSCHWAPVITHAAASHREKIPPALCRRALRRGGKGNTDEAADFRGFHPDDKTDAADQLLTQNRRFFHREKERFCLREKLGSAFRSPHRLSGFQRIDKERGKRERVLDFALIRLRPFSLNKTVRVMFRRKENKSRFLSICNNRERLL